MLDIKKITGFIIDNSDLTGIASSRNLTIAGDVGAKFTLFISNEDIFKFYNFTTDVFATIETRLYGEIPSGGVYIKKIDFPTVTDDDQYDFQLTANTHHKTELAFGSDKVYYKKSILQKTDRTVKAQSTTTTTGDFQSLASVVTVATKQAISTSIVDYAFKETIKAVDAITGGALALTRQPLPSDFKFSVVHESIGLGTAATPSTNPTKLYLDSVDNLAVSMAVATIESSSIAGSPVITKIDVVNKIVTLSVAQTWVTEKDITFKGSCGTPQVNIATGANITITDMSVKLTPFKAVVTPVVSASDDIVCETVHGIKVGSTYTGIGVNNETQQFVTALAYGSNSFTTTSAQTLKDNTILTFEGSSQEAVFKAKIKVTKMPKENLILLFQLDNILTSSTT